MTEQELKQLWKAQPTESVALSAHELQQQADAFQRGIGRRNRIEHASGALVIAVFCFYFWLIPSSLVRLGCVLTILGVLVISQQLHRRASSRSRPPESLAMSCLSFHRAELVRQRDALREVWLWYVAPLVPGAVVFRWGFETEISRSNPAWIDPLADLSIVATAFAVVWLNRRGAQQLQRQIDRLDRVASE